MESERIHRGRQELRRLRFRITSGMKRKDMVKLIHSKPFTDISDILVI